MRVVVVGGGLAGASAALSAVEAGASVDLVGAGPGSTALGWGTLDVAAAAPGSRRMRYRSALRDAPLTGQDRLDVLVESYPSHPYATLWRRQDADAAPGRSPDARDPGQEVKQATAFLDAALAPHGLRVEGSLDANRLLADEHGAVRVVDFAFSGPAEGDLSEASEVAWVRIHGLPGPPASAVVRRFAAEFAALGHPPVRLRAPVLRLPAGLPVDSPARLAAALETEAGFAAFAEAAADLVADLPGDRLWLFPAVLGFARVAERRAALAERLGGPVGERLGVVPGSTPGYRLQRALDAALESAGVRRHAVRAEGIVVREGRAAEVALEAPDAALPADAIVLATGRFLAGGLRDEARGVREPLLGLPLFDASGRRVDGRPARQSLKRRYLDAQPLYSAGACVDGRLRALSAPAGEAGARVVLPNLHVAGDLLGGFDPSRERTGLGVALVTGRLAGRLAVEVPPASAEPPEAGGADR